MQMSYRFDSLERTDAGFLIFSFHSGFIKNPLRSNKKVLLIILTLKLRKQLTLSTTTQKYYAEVQSDQVSLRFRQNVHFPYYTRKILILPTSC